LKALTLLKKITMRKSKPKKEDIVVFAFKKGSQAKFYDTENSTYRFVDASIQRMMTEYNVISDNIALSSDRVTLVNYISSLIDVYIKIYNIDIEKVEDFDPVDFDPDRDIENTVVYRM
jgi:hypothetical protein